MRTFNLPQTASSGSGASVRALGMTPMWVHVSGTVAAQLVVEGAASFSGSVNDGPYYTMITIGAAGMFQLTGLAEKVRLTQTSGSSPSAKFTLIGAEESK